MVLAVLALLFFMLVLTVATDVRPRPASLEAAPATRPGLGMLRWLERFPLPSDWGALTFAAVPSSVPVANRIEDAEAQAAREREVDAAELSPGPLATSGGGLAVPSWQIDRGLGDLKLVNFEVPLLQHPGSRPSY